MCTFTVAVIRTPLIIECFEQSAQSPTWAASPSAAARQLLLPCSLERGASSRRPMSDLGARAPPTDGRGLRRRPPLSLARSGCRSVGRLARRGRAQHPFLPPPPARPSVEAAPRGSVDHAAVAAAGVFFLAGRGREIGALRDGFHYLFLHVMRIIKFCKIKLKPWVREKFLVRESHPNQIVIAQTNNFAAAADTTCKTGGRRRMGGRARGEQPYTEDAGRKFRMRQRLCKKWSSTTELQFRGGYCEFTISIKGTGRNTNRILGISGRPWETDDATVKC